MKNPNTLIGVCLPTATPRGIPARPEQVGEMAEWAENAGFDALWVGDHIVHPMQFMESLTSLAFAAGRTRRIRIGTAVLLLPMRQLSIVASQIATLQNLSGGRFHLGLGVGGEWPKEWSSAGIPLKERGPRMDEMVPLLRRLLAGETVDFDGRFHSLAGISIAPTPPPVPFYFSGRVPAALERSARFGDGWIGFFLTLNGFVRDTGIIREARERLGTADRPYRFGMMHNFHFDTRDDDADLRAAHALNESFPPDLRLTPPEKLRRFVLAGTPAKVAAEMQAWIDAGCEMFALAPIACDEKRREDLEILATEVLPRLKGVKVRID